MIKKTDRIKIIHQDENILVINKPSGVSVTKDRCGKASILEVLNVQLKLNENDELRLIHRLDKATSGVMLVARNLKTQSIYSSLFENRLIQKSYLALVNGYSFKKSGCVKTPISHSRKNPGTMVLNPRRGKEAYTDWKILADFGLVSLVEAKPLTGRTHQIRIHMKSIGMPLAIDPIYGSKKPIMLSDFKPRYRAKNGEEKPLIDRLTLHAYQITIPKTEILPETTFIAKLDKKFAAAVKMLTKHNPNGTEAFENPDDFKDIIDTKLLTR